MGKVRITETVPDDFIEEANFGFTVACACLAGMGFLWTSAAMLSLVAIFHSAEFNCIWTLWLTVPMIFVVGLILFYYFISGRASSDLLRWKKSDSPVVHLENGVITLTWKNKVASAKLEAVTASVGPAHKAKINERRGGRLTMSSTPLILIQFPAIERDLLGFQYKSVAAVGYTEDSFRIWAKALKLKESVKIPRLKSH